MTRPIAETAVEPHAITGVDLDAAFGEALPPARIDKLEKKLRPRSLRQLDEESARLLQQLISATERGLGVTRYVYCDFPILWVVDDRGKLWFSLEEIVNVVTHEFVLPRAGGGKTVILEGNQRIGHPSLIGGAPGRIGGEILFDLKLSAWIITNGSGRYGQCAGRYPHHLSNAAKKFAELGVVLHDRFYPTYPTKGGQP